MPAETYLGDAVYASFDGFQILLRTGDGNAQRIYMDLYVVEEFLRYVRRVKEGDIDAGE